MSNASRLGDGVRFMTWPVMITVEPAVGVVRSRGAPGESSTQRRRPRRAVGRTHRQQPRNLAPAERRGGRLWMRCGLWLVAAWLGVGCAVSELDFTGKRCDAVHACPAGYLCVTRPISPAEVQGHCYKVREAPACPAPFFCPKEGAWVEACAQDGFSSTVSKECTAPAVCNPDVAVCSRPCALADDCGSVEMCDTGTGLCRPALEKCAASACPNGTCQDKTCVTNPRTDATAPDSLKLSLECFFSIVAPPATPESCKLSGRVNLFPSIPTDKTAELMVILFAPQIPGFEPLTALVERNPDDNGYARYNFHSVPTNTPLVIEVSAGPISGGGTTVTTQNAGFILRADACKGGEAVRNVSVLSRSLFESYSTVMSPWDERRGILLGRMVDCTQPTPQPIVHGVIGLALPPPSPGRVAYFADGGTLIPDLMRSDTSDNGYFLVAGLPACPNQIAFVARQGGTPRPLGTVDFVTPPDGAVIVDLPPASSRLP